MAAKLALIRNARIWVSGQKDKNWMLFSVATGRILDIGDDEPPATAKQSAQVLDLDGARVFPGFHDSHIHVSLSGRAAHSVNAKDCTSIAELQSRVKEFAGANTHLSWITGASWEQDKMGRYPNRFDLDEVCSDRPVFLARICHHLAVVNSKALELVGINKDTVNPSGGEIDRFPSDHPRAGEPTGILREDPAIIVVRQHIKGSSEENQLWIQTGLDMCLKNGLTAVHTIENNWSEYKLMSMQNKLPIRVFYSALNTPLPYADTFPKPEESCGLLSCDRVKIFADGGLGGATAAISLPYKGHEQCGLLLNSQESLDGSVQDATSAGYRLEIHVIGDRAAESAIEALEKARVAPEKRPILTHCQLLRGDLVDRMCRIGAIANIQPQFVTTDARWLRDILPDKLMPWAYAWKSLMDKGIVCAGGSDSPVESPQPLIGIYDAIFRPNGVRNADDQDIFKPQECLNVKEAIDLYTKAGAYTTRREQDLGQLLPGFYADFVVLEAGCDPVENPKLFLTAKVAQVWVAGIEKLQLV